MKRMITALTLAASICLGISVPVSAINTPFQDVPSTTNFHIFGLCPILEKAPTAY